jgi:hypothetical protein
MKTYADETMEIAITRGEELQTKFVEEVRRLLKSGAVDGESHSRGLLYGVALENLADDFLRSERKNEEYKNLKHF